MADFCTECVIGWAEDAKLHEKKSWEEICANLNPDINVFEIFESLEPGQIYSRLLCEGCDIVAIRKTEVGELKVAYVSDDIRFGPERKKITAADLTWVDFPDRRKGTSSRVAERPQTRQD